MNMGQQVKYCPDCGYPYSDPNHLLSAPAFNINAQSSFTVDTYVCFNCGTQVQVTHDYNKVRRLTSREVRAARKEAKPQ